MKAAVISLGSTSSNLIIEEMKKLFDEVDHINIRDVEINFSGNKAEILYGGKHLPEYDCVHTLGSFRYANLLNSLTVIMPESVFMPIKADAYTVAHDKLLTQLALQKNNIPMPRTYVAATTAAARSIFGQVNYPIIMKFPNGTQGKGVLVAESFPSASSIMDALSSLRQPFIIQEFVDTDGKDIRVIVIGEEVVAAYQREAAKNEIRSNIHQGGSGAQIELDDETKRLAIKAAKAVGAQICGVDILLCSHKGPLVIEVNVSPGLQGVTKYSGINVAEKIANYLFSQTKKLKNKDIDTGMKDIMSSLDKPENEFHFVTNLDFRAKRVLLSETITKCAKLKEEVEYQVSVKPNEVLIKKL